jgi:ABC-type transporter Mla maintaining outer membrane lipid asymmetry permease subunit MlaE
MPDALTEHSPESREAPFRQTGQSVLDPVLVPLGRLGLGWLNHLGTATIFLVKALLGLFRRRQLHAVWLQTYYIGARTTAIVALVGLFTGMVLGLQL